MRILAYYVLNKEDYTSLIFNINGIILTINNLTIIKYVGDRIAIYIRKDSKFTCDKESVSHISGKRCFVLNPLCIKLYIDGLYVIYIISYDNGIQVCKNEDVF